MKIFESLIFTILIAILILVISLIVISLTISIVSFIRGKKQKGYAFSIIATLLSLLTGYWFLSTNSEQEYSNVYWLPEKKDLAGTYLLDREFHENEKLSNASIALVLKEDGTFIAKNFLFLDINSNTNDYKYIPYAEGLWYLQKNPVASSENSYSNSIILKYNEKYDKYNNENKFLKTEELQMKLSDSSFVICFFTGDPDHNQYRYYFNQIKKSNKF